MRVLIRSRRQPYYLALVITMFVLCTQGLSAQTNFSFFLGATSLKTEATPVASLGASVGFITKFNILELILIRSQVNVDKVQVDDVTVGSFSGRESVTMVCFGFGG